MTAATSVWPNSRNTEFPAGWRGLVMSLVHRLTPLKIVHFHPAARARGKANGELLRKCKATSWSRSYTEVAQRDTENASALSPCLSVRPQCNSVQT